MAQYFFDGGFSYVYLVQDKNTSELFALKKIRCPFGQESVTQALKEVEAYTLFAPNANIIQSIDHAVITESGSRFRSDGGDGGSKTVYILLPYYQRGNLQDAINANLVNHTRFPEKELMVLMLGVAKGLKSMHQYKVRTTLPPRRPKPSAEQRPHGGSGEDEEEDEPLMDGEVVASQEGRGEGDIRPYAHRDVKPALAVQDTAAEHSTMPYRAPELFDVKTGSVIGTEVDVWSLG
ncbi:hypothetical protein KEM55_002091, partial [Ascosphaera atra]